MALACCGAAGCYDTGIRPPPKAIFALFDPAAMPPVIPLPNDLTMMPASPSAVAEETFSGPIDPASISVRSVIVVDLVTMLPIFNATVTLDPTIPGQSQIKIMPPPNGWPVGHRIAIALVGSPGGLVGEGGVPVVASPAFFFARGPNAVATCSMPTPTCASTTPALSLAQAIGLEQLRQALAPLIDALVAQGIPRDQLAIVWTFTVGAP
jgi:hypothetical protein